MSSTPRLPIPSNRNLFLGRIRSMVKYAVSNRGNFMMRHSTGALATYGGTALAMAIFLFDFTPILGRIPYIKNSYPLPEPVKDKK